MMCCDSLFVFSSFLFLLQLKPSTTTSRLIGILDHSRCQTLYQIPSEAGISLKHTEHKLELHKLTRSPPPASH
ncbi:unnamed protein product [Amoebophrya sp. A25]|nr:unnamed protein product [Amoebophrya sp. A25]|eukprot:GSA25T00022147001.1